MNIFSLNVQFDKNLHVEQLIDSFLLTNLHSFVWKWDADRKPVIRIARDLINCLYTWQDVLSETDVQS